MILYAFPFACSAAVQFVLESHGETPVTRWLGRGPNRRVVGDELATVNPKLKAPTLILEDGTVLTEIVSILQELDERYRPAADAHERRQRLEWLCFVATDLHQPVLAPFFDPNTPDAARQDAATRLLPPAIEHLARRLDGREGLLDRPCAADAYALWALILLQYGLPEAVAHPALQNFLKRGLAQSHIQGVLSREREAMEG